jgi:hypothetical protein
VTVPKPAQQVPRKVQIAVDGATGSRTIEGSETSEQSSSPEAAHEAASA